ncbi:magnesium-translocating P-type ATPase, partial [Mesorhizobium sp. M8A.F.Ca.ET.059.01.1.1]
MGVRRRHPHADRRERHQPLHVVLMIGEAGQQSVSPEDGAYWSIETNDLLLGLETSVSGLASSEAASRLAKFGRNTPASTSGASALAVFARQFRSPLVLILIFAACVSAFVGEGQE